MNKIKYNVGGTENIDEMQARANHYLSALTQVYEEVLEFDLQKQSVKNVRGEAFAAFSRSKKRVELLSFALENILPESHDAFMSILESLVKKDFTDKKIEFSLACDERKKTYLGVFLPIDEKICLFCCHDMTKQREAESALIENRNLKALNQRMREVVKRFTSGMMAFKLQGGVVTPLYMTDNICRYFGIDEEEWLLSMDEGRSLSEFVTRGNFTYADFERLMKNGEAEFDYLNVENGETRRVRAVCRRAPDEGEDTFYIMLSDVTPAPEGALHEEDVEEEKPRVYIRTFGYFDVFVDGKPLAFRNEKAKELFALLVDRRGGFVSSAEAIGFLWEDEPCDTLTYARYRKVALRLKNFFDEYGIADIIETVDGKRRIVMEKVACDYFDYMNGEKATFTGLYLLNYSWGETTLGELLEVRQQREA